MADIARESALKILNTLDKKRLTLDAVMDDFTQREQKLSRRDISLIHALVYGVLRWRGHLDHIIDHFSKKPLAKTKPEMLNILRLGIFQIKFLTRIPDSAAVNTSVNLSKKNFPPWGVKFVNGLLRNVVRNIDNVPFPDPEKNKTLAIAAQYSFPSWLVQRWLNRFGDEKTVMLCKAMNSVPGISIRTNTLKTNRNKLLDKIKDDISEYSLSLVSPYGISFTRPKKSIQDFQTFSNGWFQVQDEAAQIVSMIIAPQPGERVLDACAGLGGKTGHLAQLMENKGEIIASDHDPKKLKQLNSEMDRLGISIVKTKVLDLNSQIDKKELGQFDRILIDAPCSGMGVIRRNPDSKWAFSKKNLNRYKKRQIEFLSKVTELVKPGGCLVYAVCSTEPEENDAVINSFLHKHPEFDINKRIDDRLMHLTDKHGYITTFPHIHDMDGFFSVCLIRKF